MRSVASARRLERFFASSQIQVLQHGYRVPTRSPCSAQPASQSGPQVPHTNKNEPRASSMPEGSTERRFSVGSLPVPDRPTTPRTSRFSWAGIKQSMTAVAIGGSSADAESWNTDDLPENFFDLHCKTADGAEYPLAPLFGRAVLVVNVASF